MIGRTNVSGGGGNLKLVSGTVSLSQTSTSVITTIDFKPLFIVTYSYTMYSPSGERYTDIQAGISYRASADDTLTNNSYEVYDSSWSCHRIAHSFNESTGVLLLNPLWKNSGGSWAVSNDGSSIKVYYTILGV